MVEAHYHTPRGRSVRVFDDLLLAFEAAFTDVVDGNIPPQRIVDQTTGRIYDRAAIERIILWRDQKGMLAWGNIPSPAQRGRTL